MILFDGLGGAAEFGASVPLALPGFRIRGDAWLKLGDLIFESRNLAGLGGACLG